MNHSLPLAGHAIVGAGIGLYHSLVHKGSSTPGQEVADSAPRGQCDGSIRMDIMNYFKGYDQNCYGSDGNLIKVAILNLLTFAVLLYSTFIHLQIYLQMENAKIEYLNTGPGKNSLQSTFLFLHTLSIRSTFEKYI